MDKKVLINGFGFSGYRSFGDGLTKIGPLKKVNFVIGQNNSGKSNIINYLHNHYNHFHGMAFSGHTTKMLYKDVDFHKPVHDTKYRISFPILPHHFDEHINRVFFQARPDESGRKYVRTLLTSKPLAGADGIVWATYVAETHNNRFRLEVDWELIEPLLHKNSWAYLQACLNRTNSPRYNPRTTISDVVNKVLIPPEKTPRIVVIPAIRKIGIEGGKEGDYSGEGIIERLAKIQNPPLANYDADKKKFAAINEFVQEVLEKEDAKIEIPNDADTMLVHLDGKTLPIGSLGTGVDEVIILGAAATILEDTVICVEEPELHLHPLLQRKLIRYISENTTNQYFFTSHSAHLLDATDAEIFHVTLVNGVSQVSRVSSTKERSKVCNDLGYRASDILQSNCIIWVEGPSDRIYLNCWIRTVDPELVEGIHYSIMFFGGKLFAHVSGMDAEELESEVEDFISLRQMNRNSAIVFDSDKATPQAKLNATKERLKEEFGSDDGFLWVTNGREIENYLDYDQVEESVLSVCSKSLGLISKDKWSNLLKYKLKGKKKELKKGKIVLIENSGAASKVQVARHYVGKYEVDLDVLDLKRRIDDLVRYINKANGNEKAL